MDDDNDQFRIPHVNKWYEKILLADNKCRINHIGTLLFCKGAPKQHYANARAFFAAYLALYLDSDSPFSHGSHSVETLLSFYVKKDALQIMETSSAPWHVPLIGDSDAILLVDCEPIREEFLFFLFYATLEYGPDRHRENSVRYPDSVYAAFSTFSRETSTATMMWEAGTRMIMEEYGIQWSRRKNVLFHIDPYLCEILSIQCSTCKPSNPQHNHILSVLSQEPCIWHRIELQKLGLTNAYARLLVSACSNDTTGACEELMENLCETALNNTQIIIDMQVQVHDGLNYTTVFKLCVEREKMAEVISSNEVQHELTLWGLQPHIWKAYSSLDEKSSNSYFDTSLNTCTFPTVAKIPVVTKTNTATCDDKSSNNNNNDITALLPEQQVLLDWAEVALETNVLRCFTNIVEAPLVQDHVILAHYQKYGPQHFRTKECKKSDDAVTVNTTTTTSTTTTKPINFPTDEVVKPIAAVQHLKVMSVTYQCYTNAAPFVYAKLTTSEFQRLYAWRAAMIRIPPCTGRRCLLLALAFHYKPSVILVRRPFVMGYRRAISKYFTDEQQQFFVFVSCTTYLDLVKHTNKICVIDYEFENRRSEIGTQNHLAIASVRTALLNTTHLSKKHMSKHMLIFDEPSLRFAKWWTSAWTPLGKSDQSYGSSHIIFATSTPGASNPELLHLISRCATLKTILGIYPVKIFGTDVTFASQCTVGSWSNPHKKQTPQFEENNYKAPKNERDKISQDLLTQDSDLQTLFCHEQQHSQDNTSSSSSSSFSFSSDVAAIFFPILVRHGQEEEGEEDAQINGIISGTVGTVPLTAIESQQREDLYTRLDMFPTIMGRALQPHIMRTLCHKLLVYDNGYASYSDTANELDIACKKITQRQEFRKHVYIRSIWPVILPEEDEDNNATCPVCIGTFVEPVQPLTCQHVVCEWCCVQSIISGNTRCSMCRESFGDKPPFSFQRVKILSSALVDIEAKTHPKESISHLQRNNAGVFLSSPSLNGDIITHKRKAPQDNNNENLDDDDDDTNEDDNTSSDLKMENNESIDWFMKTPKMRVIIQCAQLCNASTLIISHNAVALRQMLDQKTQGTIQSFKESMSHCFIPYSTVIIGDLVLADVSYIMRIIQRVYHYKQKLHCFPLADSVESLLFRNIGEHGTGYLSLFCNPDHMVRLYCLRDYTTTRMSRIFRMLRTLHAWTTVESMLFQRYTWRTDARYEKAAYVDTPDASFISRLIYSSEELTRSKYVDDNVAGPRISLNTFKGLNWTIFVTNFDILYHNGHQKNPTRYPPLKGSMRTNTFEKDPRRTLSAFTRWPHAPEWVVYDDHIFGHLF